MIINLFDETETLLDEEVKYFWEIMEYFEIKIDKDDETDSMLEWLDDESREDLWENQFSKNDDKSEEENNFATVDNEGNDEVMRSKNDALSNLEWFENNVFEYFWPMGVIISEYEDKHCAV